jgi:ubiquinone/menaquinone biosynthesis C-methylase UbiE
MSTASQVVCEACRAQYAMRDEVLDLAAPDDARRLTIAGASNFLPGLPWVYENLWRPRSLTLLAGEKFSVARELAWLNDALKPQPNELIVDLGSSTSLYARGIARATQHLGDSAPTILAIDIAPGMLRAGVQCARRDGVHNIAHVRANVERLPFDTASVDALVCGGSLNEFRSMRDALREAYRVGKPGGRLVTMSLLAATRASGKFAQAQAKLSGITFPTRDEFNATLDEAGWRRLAQNVIGIVAFTLLKK